jgi:hypothetical protein
MRYTLAWDEDADAALAATWLAARDRQRLSEVAARMEERLRRSPGTAGESRERGRRMLLDNSLGISFEIDAPAGSRVERLAVRLSPGRCLSSTFSLHIRTARRHG